MIGWGQLLVDWLMVRWRSGNDLELPIEFPNHMIVGCVMAVFGCSKKGVNQQTWGYCMIWEWQYVFGWLVDDY